MQVTFSFERCHRLAILWIFLLSPQRPNIFMPGSTQVHFRPCLKALALASPSAEGLLIGSDICAHIPIPRGMPEIGFGVSDHGTANKPAI